VPLALAVDCGIGSCGVPRPSPGDYVTATTRGAAVPEGANVVYPPWRTVMIKVSVMYANTPGARFDHEYYRDKHMPLVKKRLGDACLYYTVDKGLAGGAPGAPATYVGMCHIFCDSVESFQAGFGPHAKEIMADIPNYTDLTPVIQISEVVVERA
jgi:uncharacterized protein (TIGR02118 family)